MSEIDKILKVYDYDAELSKQQILSLILSGRPKRKEMPKEECQCHAYDERECGCGNYPSKIDRGFNQALDEYDNWIKECLK